MNINTGRESSNTVTSLPHTQTQGNFTTGDTLNTPTYENMFPPHLAPPLITSNAPQYNQSSLGKHSRPKDNYPNPEWEEIFEKILRTSENSVQVKVSDIPPVFCWNSRFTVIKLSAATKKKFGIEVDGIIYKVVKNSGGIVFDIKSDHILWQKIKGDNTTETEGQIQNTNAKKRKSRVSKRRRENKDHASLLERIGAEGRIEKRVILCDGKGICAFKDGTNENIAVVDGNRIDVYNKELTYLGTIREMTGDFPSGISFHGNEFFVAKEKDYSIINFQDDQCSELKLKIGTGIEPQKVIHFHNLHYILMEKSFVCNLNTMEDPVFIILYMEKKPFSGASFSDFIIGDTYTYIADYGRSQIIEYCINHERHDNNFIKFGAVRRDEKSKANSFNKFSCCKYSKPNEDQILSTKTIKKKNWRVRNTVLEEIKPNGIFSQGEYVFISSMNCIKIISKDTGNSFTTVSNRCLQLSLEETIQLSRTPGKLTVTDDNKIFVLTSHYGSTKENSEKECMEIPIDEGPASSNLKKYNYTPFGGNTNLNDKNKDIGNTTNMYDNGDVASSFKYLFSSVVLTSHLLQHLGNERKKIKEKLQLLTKWMIKVALEDSQSLPERIWSRICFFYRLCINFKYVTHHLSSENHISINLQPISTLKKKESLGSIVFINSEFKYSYERPNHPFSFGIICEKSEHTIKMEQRNDQIQTNPISVFGSTLVQVFIPSEYKTIDKRGMFVIISIDSEENPESEKKGVGEIISFADLHMKNRNSYHIVGCCTLDWFSNLILFSCKDKKPISFPIDVTSCNESICLVSMVSFPIKKQFLNNFFPSLDIEIPSEYEQLIKKRSPNNVLNSLSGYLKIFESTTKIHHL